MMILDATKLAFISIITLSVMKKCQLSICLGQGH